MTPSPRHSPTLQERTLIWLLVGVSIAFAWVLVPFYSAVLWGAIIAIVFMPLHRMLLERFKGRENWAALATLVIVLVIVILPLIMLTSSLVQEGARVSSRSSPARSTSRAISSKSLPRCRSPSSSCSIATASPTFPRSSVASARAWAA